MPEQAAVVRDYHRRTSHTLQAYARGPEALDWSEQPDPIRRFDGAVCIELPLLDQSTPSPSLAELFVPGSVAAAPLCLENLAALLELSLGISAWKAYMGDRWALRCNPSSGNLHPTEGYVVAAGISGLADGVYHYRPDTHLLEQRSRIDFGDGGPRLIIGLSSITWREGWKYGERAFRYCQLDCGHAIGAFAYASASLGWRINLLDHHSSADVAALLGLDQAGSFADAEAEIPELLLEISPYPSTADIPACWFERATQSAWQGQANRIDPHPYGSWPLIDQIALASAKAETTPMAPALTATPRLLPPVDIATHKLIRQRRSAQHFDPRVLLPLDDFLRMLDAVLWRPGLPPWPANSDLPHTHLVLFVHRIAGLRQGLYALPRSDKGLKLMQQQLREQFLWQKTELAPELLPLYLLVHADSRNAARTLSCMQPIAGDAAFAVAMLGEFDEMIDRDAYAYRQLFIEAGVIGQALYLEAEAVGYRGTGIGCYFDPSVHETLGLTDTTLQSMYHFTVGMPLVDDRIETLPAYAHIERRT
ncbi:nitroreductase family protein [Mariprofundus ferrooxydans]|uniref:nitroreductase family protein n=1 Tax=Mariprofundus ferrooxydans TaxID=314344 RepID=UPI00143209C6|nr:nitroreductase family protein [Mariprofundus ferrooxydans]